MADGVGSRPRAKESADAVCESVVEVLGDPSFASDEGVEIGTRVETVFARRTSRWSASELGATCLFSWAVGDRLLVGICGDGAVFVLAPDGAKRLESPQREWRNVTDTVKPGGNWSYWVLPLPDLVVLATDGVADDVARGSEGALLDAVEEHLVSLGQAERSRRLESELENWPTPWTSDDLSLAVHVL